MKLKKIAENNVVKVPVKPLFTVEEMNMLASEYNDLSEQIKVLQTRKDLLSEKIKNGAEALGVKDDKGSFYLESDNFIMGKVASKSISLDQPKAVEYLESKDLTDCIDSVVVKTINESRLKQAIASKKITLKEVEVFTVIKVGYKVSVKAKEEMPVIEQSTLAVAKTKKK